MGYRTFVTLKVVQYGPGQTEKDFKDILEQADPCMLNLDEPGLATFDDNNGNCLNELVQLSANYPDMILEAHVDGTTEDSNDQRAVRIRNGKMETNSAEISFPPFCDIITSDEKERCAKAREVSYGRDDLLEVAEKMAGEFCDEPIGEDLCTIMADAAFKWLSRETIK